MTLDGHRLAGAVPSLEARARPAVDRWRAGWAPELGDAVLYALAAVFAAATVAVSSLSLYRVWGEMAVGPYAVAAVASVVLFAVRRRRRRRGAGAGAPDRHGGLGRAVRSGRVWLLVAVLVGATVVPLAVEIVERGRGQVSAHVQPEVVVIDQAAVRLAHGKDPYHAIVRHDHLVSAVPGEPAYESFFPYLPLMAVFGLPSSTHQPVQLTDARIFFSVVTLLVAGGALALSAAPRHRKVRAYQVVAVLPTAALPLATGGDDMPVVALLLLAMVLAQRRRPGWSGIVFGIVSAMKFTAWPMAALALFAARDAAGRRAPGRMVAGMAVVAAPVVVPFAASNLGTFFSNVILFPLGLSGVASPAASDLPGHLLVLAFPWLHRALPLAVGLVGGGYLLRRLWQRPPVTASTVAYLSGWVMLVALTFAPATRVGYLLYPANFFMWGWMFAAEDRRAAWSTASDPAGDLVPV